MYQYAILLSENLLRYASINLCQCLKIGILPEYYKNLTIAYIIELKQLLLQIEIEFIIKILFKLLNKDIISLSNLDFFFTILYII